jgi:predicted anti-sigma-YlaC factor YlaD
MNWKHSCKRVAELLSQRLDEPLGPLDRLRLRVHLSMCDNCRHVESQLAQLRSLSSDLFERPHGPPPGEPPAPGRARSSSRG